MPAAINTILSILNDVSKEVHIVIFQQLFHSALSTFNQQVLCNIGLIHLLLSEFFSSLLDLSDQLNPILYQLLERLIEFQISPPELRLLLRLISPNIGESQTPSERNPLFLPLLRLITAATKNSQTVSSLVFDMSNCGYSAVQIPSVSQRPWPPTNSYSLAFWIYLEDFGKDDELPIISFLSEEGNTPFLNLSVRQNGLLKVNIAKTSPFSTLSIPLGCWAHVALTHSKGLFKGAIL